MSLSLNSFSIFKPLSFYIIKDKTGLQVGSKNPDSDIFDLLKKDINKGFSLVVERYSSKLYWHIRRIVVLHEDADDALQNTFINAWRNISDFRKESAIYTWLYTIATNEALALINKRTRNYAISLDEPGGYFASSKEGSTWFDGDEAQKMLQNAILQLPAKQRIVFNLKYFDEMPYEEMSRVLNTSVGALKASYHHAVKKIENFINKG